jgi:hypothetical protein
MGFPSVPLIEEEEEEEEEEKEEERNYSRLFELSTLDNR